MIKGEKWGWETENATKSGEQQQRWMCKRAKKARWRKTRRVGWKRREEMEQGKKRREAESFRVSPNKKEGGEKIGAEGKKERKGGKGKRGAITRRSRLADVSAPPASAEV